MELKVNASGPWQHTLEIEVPAEEVERRLETITRDLQRRVALPGFRKGKAPLDLVRQNFADTVEQQFLESTLNETTGAAIREAKLEPVVPALVREVRYSPGQPLTFQAVVDVRPQVEAKDFEQLPAVRRTRAVDDAAVDAMLGRLREDSAVFADLDRAAQMGDVVLVESVRLDANGRRLPTTRAKGVRLELGNPDMLPDLEAALLGAEAGQTRTVTIQYPAGHPTPELAGKTVRYEVRVRKIQEKKLRELDDNLARDVFQLGSVDELRSRIRLNLEGEEHRRVTREMESAIADELVRRNPFELPERLTQYMLARVLNEATGGREMPDHLRAEMEQRYRPGVEHSLRREALLQAVARQQSLTVGEDEVAAEIDRMAQAEPRQAARIRARYQDAERRQALAEGVLERTAMRWLIEHADVREEVLRDEPLVVPAAR